MRAPKKNNAYRATASSVQMSHFPPKQIIEHSNKNTKQ